MSKQGLNSNNSTAVTSQSSVNSPLGQGVKETPGTQISRQPTNQLSNGLLGWYAACSTQSLKKGDLHFFSMYNEPLIIYRDQENRVRCLKDLCPHRGASFQGGKLENGELVCPYHGARFSSNGDCTNLDRITCHHIVDSNYNNYAKKIHLYQYPCIEKGGYVYIYYSGKAQTNVQEFDIKTTLEDSLPESYGFKPEEYSFEEVCVDFKCDWARIIENHLDILHIFWVHGDTIPDKDVNRNVITSFNQKITRDYRHIESKYNHKDKSKGEFITLKFVPPGRVFIYKGDPKSARYVQVLDHIPLGNNRARVIVRHYRKFLQNKVFTSLVMFQSLQHRIFYKVFSEDYLILKTQTYNEQMGYIQKDNVKLLGEDKMVQYYWDWLQNALKEDKPWDLHATTATTNTVYNDMPMIYPPENNKLAQQNSNRINRQILTRLLLPLTLLLILL